MSPTWTYSCICGHGSAWICHDILQGGDRPATVSALSPSTGLYGYQVGHDLSAFVRVAIDTKIYFICSNLNRLHSSIINNNRFVSKYNVCIQNEKSFRYFYVFVSKYSKVLYLSFIFLVPYSNDDNETINTYVQHIFVKLQVHNYSIVII